MTKRFALVGLMLVLAATAPADVWRITYDLTGSTLKIAGTPLGAGDGTFNIGPGEIVLEFANDGGTPDTGLCAMTYLGIDVEFTSGNAVAQVDSDLFVFADYDTTALNSRGIFESGSLSWIDMVPYRTVGTNLCNGTLCAAGGLPNGTPVTRDDAVTLSFNPFVFETGGPAAGAGFTMAELVVSTEDDITTSLSLVGTEQSRELLEDCDVNDCHGVHSADQDNDNNISLSELLRLVQLFNAGGFGCDVTTEDLYIAGGDDESCNAHTIDFESQDWAISFGEILRGIQLFNFDRYNYCGAKGTEDGFCAL
jgi:hypothetical protein